MSHYHCEIVIPPTAEAKEKMSGYREEWREKNAPTEDWLVVTVDYHS